MEANRKAVVFLDQRGLNKTGSFFTFAEMANILDESQTELISFSDTPQHLVLRALANNYKLKPSFTTEGFSIVPITGPDVECPPTNFSFDEDWPKPQSSNGDRFYPILNKSNLDHLFIHSVRWFKHPFRPGTMFPLRLESFFLGVEHPVSRMYVDLPVVFPSMQNVSYLRISLNVFEMILASQTGARGKWIQLKKAGPLKTNLEDKGEPSQEVYDLIQAKAVAHSELYERNKHIPAEKDPTRHAARIVADHLVRLN